MDYIKEAKENYKDAKEAVEEQYQRIREDFRFSNPSDPQQWDEWAKNARKGRPMHTLDRTNLYVQHVVNSTRQNKTSCDVLPADSKADSDVANQIKGIIRHIEYTSRADIAWDTASDHQARGGLGWVRVIPKVVNADTNEQEILISRVHDPLSCLLDPNSTEPDGSDAMFGFAETNLTEKAFDRLYPKAKKDNFDPDGWFAEDSIRICEYLKVEEEDVKKVAVDGPDGGRMALTEDDYKTLVAQIGYEPPIVNTFTVKKRTIRWLKMSGSEILEETEYPSQWIGIVPVIGHEIWVEGKRYLCGLVRRLRDGQKLHNFEMSAMTEALMLQPKAPFLIPARGISGHEDAWQGLNSGTPTHLPYNDIDENGQPVAPPTRLSPPNFPVGYANTANLAVQEMENAVGMYKSAFGQQSNAVSGRAKLADQSASETSVFHFQDNKRVAQTHVYRIIVDMLPRIYDQRRQARILGEDGQQGTVDINPEMNQPAMKQGNKVVSINPGVGRYDVRVKVGPSYTTLREELGTQLQELGKGNPVLAAALTPILMKLSDMPEADKISRIAMAMLPPEVQKAYNEEGSQDIPPQIQAEMQQQAQQIQQMSQAMDTAGKLIQGLKQQVDEKNTKVQDEAGKAMAEIKAAQAGLQAQADSIAAKERELADALKIAQLELQLQAANADTQDTQDAQDKQESTPSMPMQVTVPSNDEAVKALAETVKQAQETMANALKQSADANAQIQSLIVDAIEDMADAVSAPRKIQLQKGKDGRTVGATSVAVLPDEEPGEKPEE
jgi:hypothetical protein